MSDVGHAEDSPNSQHTHTRYLQQAYVQPLEDLRIVKLGVCGSDCRLQDTGQVVLVQSGGGTHQLRSGYDKQFRLY